MASTLAWLDHDTSARERTKRILALFQERGTVDQLGLGGIRNAFADLMFPGTSTIQTRLRYFLFIPWIYSRLEQDEVPANRFASTARAIQLSLVEPLLSASEEGIFGKLAGGDLKRLPSDVYWGGLGTWGIRRFDASPRQYYRAIDEIYTRRKRARRAPIEATESEPGVVTWHPDLPAPPPEFPEEVTLSLRVEEAEFLRDRIVAEHPSTVLAWLALHGMPTNVPYVWEHPRADALPDEQRHVVEHARVFSHVMEGAPILYNRMLAEEAGRPELVEEYVAAYDSWMEALDVAEVADWSEGEVFSIARSQGGHTITPQAEEFVRRWVAMVRDDTPGLPSREDARNLTRNREIRLKGARSFFRNSRALEERYNGGLGMGRMTFRWPGVQVLLNDLHDGLEAGDDA